MNGVLLLDPDQCRVRQSRLLERMAARELDAAVIASGEHLDTHRPPLGFPLAPAAVLLASGRTLLVCPDKPVSGARRRTPHLRSRVAINAAERPARGLCSRRRRLAGRGRAAAAGRRGVFQLPPHLTRLLGDAECLDIEPDLLTLRRRKDPDELALLRTAIAATGEMISVAREIVRPGVMGKLEAFQHCRRRLSPPVASCSPARAMIMRVVSAAGRRDRSHALAGDLDILDLGPAYRGYFADTSRVIAVDGRPTDRQHVALATRLPLRSNWSSGSPGPESGAGRSTREVQEWLGQAPVGSWSSHLGHGIGLAVHEGPHSIPTGTTCSKSAM